MIFSRKGYKIESLNNRLIYERGLDLVMIDLQSTPAQVTYLLINKSQTLTKNLSKHELLPQKWEPQDFFKYTGRNIIVSTFDCPPFVEISKNNVFGGVEYEFLKDFTKSWPVEYKIIENKNTSVRVNHFLEVIERIKLKKADIGVCFIWQRALMERNLDYSFRMFPTCLTFLVLKPDLLKSSLFLFQPFQDNLWVVFLVIFTLLVVLYKNFIGLPNFLSKEVYLISSFVFLGLIFSYYSAELTTQLNFPRFLQNYVRNFEDMIEKGIKWEEPRNDIQLWFEQTKDPLCTTIAKNFRQSSDRISMNKHVLTGKYGLLVKMTSRSMVVGSEELDDQGKTRLRLLPGCLAWFYSSIAFPKHSPLKKHFNRKINLYFSNGLLSFWESMTIRKSNYRYMKNFKEIYMEGMVHRKIDMEKLTGIFYFLICGYIFSVICFILEYLSVWFSIRLKTNIIFVNK
ncbi:uncharacterized protein LOC115887192 [Sitophilus oryzae]|uniref:Uncharacterized protein LOC115887192 n=1 Tax=Sitophilus oryzae TaxID=7048 RepID=A0A6J2YH14_SITOR|nr:uncharacterized protein LOC115887192 [Sitophilus oryzae]